MPWRLLRFEAYIKLVFDIFNIESEKKHKAERKEPEKPSLSVLGILIANYLLGLGIAAIGKQAGNKREFYAGLAFAVIYILIVFHQLALGYEIEIVRLIMLPISILSWVYIIVRLIMLRGKVDYRII